MFYSIEAFELLIQHIFTKEDIVELCLKGLLLHDFGSNIIRYNLVNINEIASIKVLKDKLYQAIETGNQLKAPT